MHLHLDDALCIILHLHGDLHGGPPYACKMPGKIHLCPLNNETPLLERHAALPPPKYTYI